MARGGTRRDEEGLLENPLYLEARRLLREAGLQLKKRRGQHLLIDQRVLDQVLTAAELLPEDTVVEVGPGLGVLTRELALRVRRVIAIELDPGLVSLLRRALAGFPNLELLQADALQIRMEPLLGERGDSGYTYKVVANIPYYITSPLLRHFLEANLKPKIMVVMVQEEVAERIVATPGQMGFLSVMVQFYGNPQLRARIPAASFYPRPKVDSALLRIDVYPEPPLGVADPAQFFQLVQAGFHGPRKQLRNSLAHGLGLSPRESHTLLERAGIEPHRRAQTLSLEEWKALYEHWIHG